VVGELDGVRDPRLLGGAGRRVGTLRHRLPREVEGDVPVEGAVVGLEERLQLAEELGEIGQLTPCAQGATHGTEDLLEGRAAEGVVVVRAALVGVVGHVSTVRTRSGPANGPARSPGQITGISG
jgi:hypothetical protein